MAHQVGLQMYEAVWRSDGERVAVFYMTAANEAAVLAEAKLFLKEHSDFRRSTARLTLSIRTLSSSEGSPANDRLAKRRRFPAHLRWR
jgi:hypothetical protein